MKCLVEAPRIDVFNPRRLSDQQIRALSTGREDILASLVETVTRNTRCGTLQHVALVAPRGYGKSFLLRQLRMEVESLGREGLPLAFAHLPEELPNISSIAALIDNIRRLMVGELTGGIGHFRDEAPDALDKATAALDAALDQRFGRGRGVVVAVVENFDQLLDGLAVNLSRTLRRRGGSRPNPPKGVKAADWAVETALRGLIERRNNRLMLAISATCAIQNDHPERPLFQWIQETRLEPWTDAQVLQYALRRRKLSCGENAWLSDKEQIQLKALAEFTGGAPRMIAVLVDHLLEKDLEHATLNLSALIDELTPYYQDRINVKNIGHEACVVFDALLRGGEPASQTEVAGRFSEKGLTQGSLAEAFRKLQAERLILGVKEKGGKKKAVLYRAADRVMAYWYKQRQAIGHDPAANGLSHFEEAVELLVGWYSRDDLRLEAERFARRGRREESAFLRYLSRHGLLQRNGSPGARRGPRRHLTFGFVLRLDLLARLLDPADRTEAYEIMNRLRSSADADLIETLQHEAMSGTGRRLVFLLCALAVTHTLQGAAHDREDERAEAALTQALEVAAEDMDAMVLIRLVSTMVKYIAYKDVEESLGEAKAASGLIDAVTVQEARLTAYYENAWMNCYRGSHNDAQTHAKLASAIAQKLALPAWESRMEDILSHSLNRLDRKEDALDHARQAVELARLAEDVQREADSLNMVSQLLFELNRHADSLAAAEKAAERAFAVDDYSASFFACMYQCWSLSELQRPEEALTAARKAAVWSEKACDLSGGRDAFQAEIDILNELKRHEEALVSAHRLSEWAVRNHDDLARAEALYRHGRALDYLGRRDEAVVLLRQALGIGAGDQDFRCKVLGLLGYCLGLLCQHDEATAILAEASELGATNAKSNRPINLHNLLIYADRLSRDADYTAVGPRILKAFTDLAQLDMAKALHFSNLALRVAVALDRCHDFEGVFRMAVQSSAIATHQLDSLAIELSLMVEATGRARTYAAIVSILSALTTSAEGDKIVPELQASMVRYISLYIRDAGLLRDLADYLQEQSGTAHGVQIDGLRGHALALESGADPAVLERVDPDQARLLQAMSDVGHLPTRMPNPEDADLAVRPCVVAPVGSETFAGLVLEDACAETIARFGQLAPNLGIANLEEFDHNRLRTTILPFLPEARLVLLPHRSGEITVPFVLSEGDLVLARRNNEWIYQLIAARPPLDFSYTPGNTEVLMAYSRFFFTVIIGNLGAFDIIERAEEIPFLESANEAEKEKLGGLVEPMIRLDNEIGRAVLRATILFKDALFRASVVIQADGLLELTDEELLAEDLPIRFGRSAWMVADH